MDATMTPDPLARLLPHPCITYTHEISALIPWESPPSTVLNARAALSWVRSTRSAFGDSRYGQAARMAAFVARVDAEERHWIAGLSPSMRQKWLNLCAYDVHHLTPRHAAACRQWDFALARRLRHSIETARRVACLLGCPLPPTERAAA